MMVPRLDENDFETEKEVIVNEIARSEEQLRKLTRRHMMHAYFGNHALGNYVLGSRDSIRNMHVTQMQSYWQQHYGAGRIVLSVAGKFNWDRLVKDAEQCCSHWPAGAVKRSVTPYEPAQSLNKIITDKKLKQQIMTITMPNIDVHDPDYYAAVLGADILGDIQGSRLYWSIQQKGLAESAYSTLWAFERAGILFLQASTKPEDASHVLKLLQTELSRLLDFGITEQELHCAKNKWISSLVINGESTTSRMRALASDWLREGHLLSIDEKTQRIEQVTNDDVMRVLHRFPLREKQVTTTYGPLQELVR